MSPISFIKKQVVEGLLNKGYSSRQAYSGASIAETHYLSGGCLKPNAYQACLDKAVNQLGKAPKKSLRR